MTESIKPQKVELHSQREILTSNRKKRENMVKIFQHIRRTNKMIDDFTLVSTHFKKGNSKETR
ncbi:MULTISPECIES: hypothetical protein [unclassified Paenibacillus]|uniref:hypothetical protein n=1 Tax=unclassified Paenibacillus TaxID=185978 RepID=UPI00122E5344|nr:hypothetical protein [Paenibacillus sp. 37]